MCKHFPPLRPCVRACSDSNSVLVTYRQDLVARLSGEWARGLRALLFMAAACQAWLVGEGLHAFLLTAALPAPTQAWQRASKSTRAGDRFVPFTLEDQRAIVQAFHEVMVSIQGPVELVSYRCRAGRGYVGVWVLAGAAASMRSVFTPLSSGLECSNTPCGLAAQRCQGTSSPSDTMYTAHFTARVQSLCLALKLLQGGAARPQRACTHAPPFPCHGARCQHLLVSSLAGLAQQGHTSRAG